MKTVLIYTSPARGHLYPMMDIAETLIENGWRVLIQTMASEKENVEPLGAEHLPISAQIEQVPLNDYMEKNPINQIKATFECWLKRAPYEIEDLRKSRERFTPDMLVIDANCWGAGAYTEALDEPWCMFMPYCLPVRSVDTPVFGPGFKPPRNILHRLRDRFVHGMIQTAVKDVIKKFNQLRRQVGASDLKEYQEIFDCPDLILYRTTEPFDYHREVLPSNLLPIGPGLWSPSNTLPDWVHTLPKPRILVSVSTEKQNDRAIIETAIDALADEDYSLLITTAALDPDSFNSTNENVRIDRFLPHSELIPYVDLVITHGGMGTTQRALAAGVPVCVIPWGRDQKETARRVEVSNAGCMLSRNKLNRKNLQQSVRDALKQKDGAENVAKAFSASGGAELAVQAIRDLEQQKLDVKLLLKLK